MNLCDKCKAELPPQVGLEFIQLYPGLKIRFKAPEIYEHMGERIEGTVVAGIPVCAVQVEGKEHPFIISYETLKTAEKI